MPTEALVRSQSTLEIHRVSVLQMFKICASHRFLKEIEIQLVAETRAHCEAATVNGHAVAAPHFLCDPWGGNFQSIGVFSGANTDHSADFLDQTAEHFSVLDQLTHFPQINPDVLRHFDMDVEH
jgi:hypothetical protein